MALPLEHTLETARQKVLLRCGMNQQASHNANIQPIVDEYIRSAHHMFFHEVEWTSLRSSEEVTLITDQNEYDFPDASDIGQLTAIYVLDTSGVPYDLAAEPTPQDRYNAGTDASRPLWFRLIDKAIEVYPVPDITEYPTLVIEYTLRESALANDSDRLQVDSDLVITQASADMRGHLRLPGVQELQAQALRMLDRIKSQNTAGAVISLYGYPRMALYGNRYEPPSRQYNYANADNYYSRQVVDQRGFLLGG